MLTTVLFLSGCFREKSEITPPGRYSEAFVPLDSTTVIGLTELTTLVTRSDSGAVAIAQYFPVKNSLIAVYSGDGFLRAWDIHNTKVLFEYDLGIISNNGIGLDQTGNLVMGARWQTNESFGVPGDFVGGIGVWNIETGDLVTCITTTCERMPLPEEMQHSLVSGATLDPKGKWVLSNYETSVGIDDITGVEVSYSTSEMNFFDDSYRDMALFAFDSRNDRFAIALRDGGVLIQKLGGSSLGSFSPKISLGTYEERSWHKVTALSFSSDGQWLARLQDDILTVWNVSSRSGKLHFEYEIPAGQLLAFDQLSEMLFVGTSKNIGVWDMKKIKLIGEFAAPDITTLAVSGDNRLLIWGDKSGQIHIWGVP